MAMHGNGDMVLCTDGCGTLLALNEGVPKPGFPEELICEECGESYAAN